MKNSELRRISIELRDQNRVDDFKKEMLAEHFICKSLSIPISTMFIKYKVSPNAITLDMIILGIIGSILFALPNIYCKILGYFIWILWFTMDLCDGQVARYTKTFSKYGAEMDYIAHLLDHPAMNLAIFMTFLQMDIFNPILLGLLFIINISIELIFRNIVAFDHFHDKYNYEDHAKVICDTDRKTISFLKYFITQSILYPTLIVCYSWIFIIGYAFDLYWMLYLYICWLLINIMLNSRLIIRRLIRYYRL